MTKYKSNGRMRHRLVEPGTVYGCLTVLEYHGVDVAVQTRYVDNEPNLYEMRYHSYLVECNCGKRQVMRIGNIKQKALYPDCTHQKK